MILLVDAAVALSPVQVLVLVLILILDQIQYWDLRCDIIFCIWAGHSQ